MNEPTKFRAGDTVTWSEDARDYPASDGWRMIYTLSGEKTLSVSATAAGDMFDIRITSAQSATLDAGLYSLTKIVERGDGDSLERHTISSLAVAVLANLSTPVAGDARTHLQKVLDSIKAVIERRATQADESLTINGRSLSRTPIAELLKLYKQYEYLVEDEERRLRQDAGLKTKSQKIVMHFR